jgi:hypothetical protein
MLPFPAGPFVGLNFLYFVLSTLIVFVYPGAQFSNISFAVLPTAILLMAVAFGFFSAAVVLSGRMRRTWLPQSVEMVTVRGMGVIVAAAMGASWALRIYLAIQGVGITHAGDTSRLPRNIAEVAVAGSTLQFIPICLCITRLCSDTLSAERVRAWQVNLVLVLISDGFYFLMAGSRLMLLMEILIVLWALWFHLISSFPRRWYVCGGLVLALVVPLIYAQRAALRYVSPRARENQLQFARKYIFQAQSQLLETSARSTIEGGVSGDTGRLSAIAGFSAIAEKNQEYHLPLMRGETVKDTLPFLVPRIFWPSKPAHSAPDLVIEKHFNLQVIDQLMPIETEAFANWGMVGLCLSMFLYGALTDRFFGFLIRVGPAHEPVTFCLLYLMPVIFTVETGITGLLSGFRVLPFLFALLMLMSTRRKSPARKY